MSHKKRFKINGQQYCRYVFKVSNKNRIKQSVIVVVSMYDDTAIRKKTLIGPEGYVKSPKDYKEHTPSGSECNIHNNAIEYYSKKWRCANYDIKVTSICDCVEAIDIRYAYDGVKEIGAI
jgi:hypothetical protein